MFITGKPFQLSQMFVGKAGAYPSEAPFRGLYYKTFTAVIYRFSLKARVFVPGKPFQPGLMFVGTRMKNLSCDSSLLRKSVIYVRKKFYYRLLKEVFSRLKLLLISSNYFLQVPML